ncbi:MAG TPA: radical SAM protein [Myxococcota bacterium]|nr:radical SAM protein [Myxococcota bacterium]
MTPLKETRTLCPDCLRPLVGLSYEEGGKVYLERTCPEHGRKVALIAGDRKHYWLRDEVPHPPLSADEKCAVGPEHRSCVALLELTDACNLACPACYAQSPAGKHRPLPELKEALSRFIRERGPLDVLQLSGGEPTIHPDFLAILDFARRAPIGHVMVNTNGIELARSPTLAAELAKRKPKIELYLQMDGLDERSHSVLRGAKLLELKRKALEQVRQHDLPTTLVCTVVQGVNDQEIGELLRLGLGMPQIRGVTLQPATSAGRFELPLDPLSRATLSEVIQAVEAQSAGKLAASDFKPLPCSNPNCCSFTFIARPRQGPQIPLTRLIQIEDHLEKIKDRISFTVRDAEECCGVKAKPDEVFRVVVKPFMDAWTYDQDRIDECCTHILRPDGSSVSFCQYNTLERGRSTGKDPA